jgi:hypothetical protein
MLWTSYSMYSVCCNRQRLRCCKLTSVTLHAVAKGLMAQAMILYSTVGDEACCCCSIHSSNLMRCVSNHCNWPWKCAQQFVSFGHLLPITSYKLACWRRCTVKLCVVLVNVSSLIMTVASWMTRSIWCAGHYTRRTLLADSLSMSVTNPPFHPVMVFSLSMLTDNSLCR